MSLLDKVIGVVTSAAKAYAEGSKKKTSSSNSSSSSKTSTTTNKTNSSSYTPKGSNTDSYIQQTNTDDYNAIQAAKQAYAEAQKLGDQAGMSNANAAANAIRAKYGYSGGTDGSEYIGINNTYENPYEEAMKEMQKKYDALAQQQKAANQLAVNQGVQRLENQKTNINKQYDDNARQAYIANMQAKKNLPQQLAASGINGGAAETTNLGVQTSYENNLNSINNNRVNAINDIDNAIVELKNNGDLTSAEQALANSQAALDSYKSLMGQKINYDINKQETDFNRELSTISQYSDDFQAEINRRSAINPNDPLIPYLIAARQEKINAQKEAENQATSSAVEQERELAWNLFQELGKSNSYIEAILGIPSGTTTMDYTKNQYDINKPYYNPKTSNPSAETITPSISSHKNIIESNFAIKNFEDIIGYDTDKIYEYIMQENTANRMSNADAINLLYQYGLKNEADQLLNGG